MKKDNFKVIRGGLLDSANTSRKTFVSAYVTNTRLMGVLGMYIHFKLPDNKALFDLHQFFYFDAEEYGFETYDSVLGPDDGRVSEIESSLIGGLGGEKIDLTLREAQFILQEYVRLNRKENIPMPEGFAEYEFLLEEDIHMTEPELFILMCKQCVQIDSPYELINYFLMRCFGKDFGAAAYLTTQDFDLELFSDFRAGTFCKNTIDKGNAPNSYINESLVEFDDSYYVIVTHVELSQMRICNYERISAFRVSSAEAAMMLSRSEFVSVYKMLADASTFTATSTKLTPGAMVTKHDTGILYMIFHPNNKHVAKKEYRLNEDVLGMYFVSDSGQLISASYSLEEIRQLEIDLGTSSFGRKLIPTAKYEFQEPVLYEFIQSGFEDFELFVDAIKTGE